ncbi:hypothetical protein [Streptomyces sp. NPDC020681]|uniref:hypothetical protein n=1 Tax=Streptomyces sp. NPDC020681 TaxID=3365083 RepID=UPI0037A7287B
MAHFHARLLERVASAHPMLLWLAGAAAMGLSGNRSARRAALRGTSSVVLASAAINIAAQSLSTDSVPSIHRLLRQPITRAFPSGHAASAAAFATALTLESPWLGAVVATRDGVEHAGGFHA